MSDMADVLNEHRDIAWNYETGQAICGDCDTPLGPKDALMDEQDRWLRLHQAAELSAAGFGRVTA
jgi:hypothetical protein